MNISHDEIVTKKENQITMQLQTKDENEKWPPHFPEMNLSLRPYRLDSYLEKITGYSFAATMVVMLAFFGMLN